MDIITDPLDGSFLFLKGISYFSSICLIILENKKVKYSFVQSLASHDLYYCDETAAFLNDQILTISPTKPDLIMGFAAKPNRFEYVPKLKYLKRNFMYYNTGGSLMTAKVASNNVSAVIEFKPTGLYEMAGAFIAQKAGAFVETIDGQELSLDPTLKQTVIVANSKALLTDLQNCLRE